MAAAAEQGRSEGAAEAGPARGWVGWLVQVLCLLYAAFVIFEDVQQSVWYLPTPLTAQAGTLGEKVDRRARDGWVAVDTAAPGGAMAKAGVVAGDRVRFDRVYDYGRRLRAGEAVGFTLVHAGRTSHLQVLAQPRKPPPLTGLTPLGEVYCVATTLAALFGAFIIWRSQRTPTTLLLGMALLTYGLIVTTPQLWVAAAATFPFVYAVGIANITVIPILFYAFALGFYRDHVAPPKPWERLAFWLYAAVMAVAGAADGLCKFYATSLHIPVDSYDLAMGVSYVGYAICLGYLVLGWRRSAAAVQQRYALMLVATAAIILAQAIDVLTPNSAPDSIEAVHFVVNSLLTGVIASGLFAYCILRHKVFDLGFAVNRTLVYGVVSAILLAAFGLIEWAVDHFVPIEGREKNALIDAAIAVGVFLTFHRVRDVVEHGIEGVFFRRWQQAEATLRRFVREAAFVRNPDALNRSFAAAVTRFAEGADASLYLLDADGRYRRASGRLPGLGEIIEVDDPALVAMRAEPKPLEPGEVGSSLDAALAAPMLNRNELTGVVLVAVKPNGLRYRPDEVELVGWAAAQVGLDLHALKVETLEADKARQAQQISLLNAKLEVALAGRQPA